jgi:hypothetical protein
MAVAGIGRRLKLWWFGAGRVFDLLGGCRRCARAENARPRQCRKSPQYAAAIPADPLHRLLPSARRPRPRISGGVWDQDGALGLSWQLAIGGAGEMRSMVGPPEDRLGADRRTAHMFAHVGGRASPGKAATAARSRQGSPDRAPDIVTPPRRGLTDAQLEASRTGMSALSCQRRRPCSHRICAVACLRLARLRSSETARAIRSSSFACDQRVRPTDRAPCRRAMKARPYSSGRTRSRRADTRSVD